jgi:hypothetical protein
VKPTDLRSLLEEFYRDKLALRQRHVAVARLVSDYDVNNTYQYVVAREEFHLRWLRSAVEDLAGTTVDVPEPQVQAPGRGDDRWKALAREDAEEAGAFVERWTSRVDTITHDRHRKMCQVVLGETLEHRRFFTQAAAGRNDLLGRRTGGLSTGGGVLPVRWVE